MAKAKGGWGITPTIESTPKKLDKVLDNILSILQLVEIKQERDIEDKESEEELYYESEKSV